MNSKTTKSRLFEHTIAAHAENIVDDINDINNIDVDEIDISDLLTGEHEGVQTYKDTDLPVFSHKTLMLFIDLAYDTKNPLLIYGDAGIGKSQSVLMYCLDVAKAKGKIFKNWSKCSDETKEEIIDNPSKYFVLIDVRCEKLLPEDLSGIPDIRSDNPYLEAKPLKWLYYLYQPEADGILFLDEINHGSPQILRSLFEVVLDRSAGDRSFSKDIAIIAAGNLGEEFGNEPLPQALISRFSAGVLVSNPDEWLEWAEIKKISPYIISFVKSNPSENFYTKPTNQSDPFPNPRSMVKFSKDMQAIFKKYTIAKRNKISMATDILTAIEKAASTQCGGYWARKFITFLKHIQTFDLKHIKDNAKEFRAAVAEKLHALIVFLVGKLRIASKHIDNGQINHPTAVDAIEALIYVTGHLHKEWSVILWNNLKRSLTLDEFKNIIQGVTAQLKTVDPETNALVTKVIKTELPAILKGE